MATIKAQRGFTLIELMIVVAIIGILAAVALPQCSSMIRKAHEAATKGNLGAMRSALSIYYGDNGTFPTDNLASLTAGQKYLNKVYDTYVEPWHSPGNVVGTGNQAAFIASNADVTNWWYYGDQTDSRWGMLLVNCTHTDIKGAVWTSY